MLFISPAKINLCLDILRCDKSGYHEIQTVYQEAPELFDEIEIFEMKDCGNARKILIECDNPDVPLDGTNTAHKVTGIVQKYFHINRGIKIKIHKKIPVFSGLGGGSSNAVTVLKCLNDLWDIHAPVKELVRLSRQISMDSAFFFYAAAYATHFGEIITSLPS